MRNLRTRRCCRGEPTRRRRARPLLPPRSRTSGPGSAGASAPGWRSRFHAGNAGLVLPRSGLAREHGIALVNSPGLIDSGYRGELRVLLLNTDPAETFRVMAGDRIAQLVVVAIASAEPVEAEELADSPRGAGGFGSSGR